MLFINKIFILSLLGFVSQVFCTEGKHAELMVLTRQDLRSYDLDTLHYKTLLNKSFGGAFGLDFDYRENSIYWTDVQSHKIFMTNLHTGKYEIKTIIEGDVGTPDGIAVDWVHRNLYFSDAGHDRIEVSRLDGSHRKTLISEDLDKPRALAVDPENGWIYWTDWGKTPKIEKSGMNGQERKAIVTEHIAWPNGLTIDYVQQRLYWVDGNLETISSCNFEGGDRKIIYNNDPTLKHPFSITLFGDNLFWSDWTSKAVHKVNTFGKEAAIIIARSLKTPMGIQVYHISRQPTGTNHCGTNNGNCTDLCLPKPRTIDTTNNTKNFECACSNGRRFGEGNEEHICIDNDKNTKKLDNAPTTPKKLVTNAVHTISIFETTEYTTAPSDSFDVTESDTAKTNSSKDGTVSKDSLDKNTKKLDNAPTTPKKLVTNAVHTISIFETTEYTTAPTDSFDVTESDTAKTNSSKDATSNEINPTFRQILNTSPSLNTTPSTATSTADREREESNARKGSDDKLDKPGIFAFTVGLSRPLNYLLKDVIVYKYVVSNTNGDYDIKTGIFKCSKAGSYFFQIHGAAGKGKELSLSLVKNKTKVISLLSSTNQELSLAANSAVLLLEAGDEVFVEASNCGSLYGEEHHVINTFSGFLLNKAI